MMSVNLNAGALIALQNLSAVTSEIRGAQNRISTGLNVASASDDGAVYAIAQGQRARMTTLLSLREGIERAGVSLSVTGVAGEAVCDLLLRMREKAFAARANDLTAPQRSALQGDFDALRAQINRIVYAAQFNGLNLVAPQASDLRVRVSDAGGQSLTGADGLPFTSISRLSETAAGVGGAADSHAAVLSPDGTRAAFTSLSGNLVAGDTNNTEDVLLKDLLTGVITRVSTTSAGLQGNNPSDPPWAFSPDGSKLLFSSTATSFIGHLGVYRQLYMKDLTTSALTLISSVVNNYGGNGASTDGVFSPDGTKVAFISAASDLVEDDTNGRADLFIRDLTSAQTVRLPIDAGGAPVGRPVFLPDGSGIAFETTAALTADTPAAAGDRSDIYIIRLSDFQISRIPITIALNHALAPDDALGFYYPRFSADGSRLAFTVVNADPVAGAVAQIWTRDLVTGSETMIVDGFNPSAMPSFSQDLTRVAFDRGDGLARQVFVKDVQTGEEVCVSVNSSGPAAFGASYPALSADGRQVVFASRSPDLTPGDLNNSYDVFRVTLPGSAGGGLYTITRRDWTVAGAGALRTVSAASGLLATPASATTTMNDIDAALSAIRLDMTEFGADARFMETQSDFLSVLSDIIDKRISRLVDVDLARESARLRALQVRQQLGLEALSIANSQPALMLSLFGAGGRHQTPERGRYALVDQAA